MKVTTECVVKAVPKSGMTMDELEARMKVLGNKVISREEDGLVVMQDKSVQTFGEIL